MTQQIKVYITAKLEHAPMLSQLHFDGFHINARWIEMADAGRKRLKPITHWQQENFDDIRMSHFVIMYVEPSDKLKGSIHEVGYASGLSKLTWIAGNARGSGDEHWGVLVKPSNAENDIRVPHKDVLPWALDRTRYRMVSGLHQAFNEIRQLADQSVILRSDGLPLPALRFDDAK